jgi:nitrite reductase/ring-hydroxylating ferredoxin subunit
VTRYDLPGTPPPPPGKALRVSVGGREVAVFNLGERLVATDARCTHVGGALDRGPLVGSRVTCPLHGSVFDVETGRVLRGPAERAIRTYTVRAEGAGLAIEIP